MELVRGKREDSQHQKDTCPNMRLPRTVSASKPKERIGSRVVRPPENFERSRPRTSTGQDRAGKEKPQPRERKTQARQAGAEQDARTSQAVLRFTFIRPVLGAEPFL